MAYCFEETGSVGVSALSAPFEGFLSPLSLDASWESVYGSHLWKALKSVRC